MSLPIVDGALYHRGRTMDEWREWLQTNKADRVGFTVPALSAVAETPPLPARIAQNWWIVECPACHDAQFIWKAGPLLFMCSECWNAEFGHLWRPVALPAELDAIEAILRDRPMPATRNWSPGESLVDLANENLEHGAELRPVDR